MNPHQHIVTTPEPDAVLNGLQLSIEVAQKLQEAGCVVTGAFSNGRRHVLLVDRAPAFVKGVCKNRFPNHLAGYTRVYAAPYHGVQVEWMEDEPGAAAAVIGHA